MIPTLKDNVTHIARNNVNSTLSTDPTLTTTISHSDAINEDIEISPSSAASTLSTSISTSTARLQEYMLPEDVRVHVLETITDIDATINDLLRLTLNSRIFVGFDCEWYFNRSPYIVGPVSLIQVAHGKCVWLLRLSQIPRNKFPKSLKLFLESNKVVKMGRNVSSDLKKIEKDYDFVEGSLQGSLDLASYCKSNS
ncbi:hypothetical protein BD408DRAFT_487123 [Parasitella parasitica]|nr:hypothetical protein BD408DRAFT_487123 [Parasitella parasitica]